MKRKSKKERDRHNLFFYLEMTLHQDSLGLAGQMRRWTTFLLIPGTQGVFKTQKVRAAATMTAA
jgi:hypothetical protein